MHDPYFKEHYKMIAINLSKQETLDDDLKAIQPINCNRILDGGRNTTMFFNIEEVKVLSFTQNKREHIVIYFTLI